MKPLYMLLILLASGQIYAQTCNQTFTPSRHNLEDVLVLISEDSYSQIKALPRELTTHRRANRWRGLSRGNEQITTTEYMVLLENISHISRTLIPLYHLPLGEEFENGQINSLFNSPVGMSIGGSDELSYQELSEISKRASLYYSALANFTHEVLAENSTFFAKNSDLKNFTSQTHQLLKYLAMTYGNLNIEYFRRANPHLLGTTGYGIVL